MLNERKAGVLMHISSLQNNEMIGSIGKEAFEFIDFLKNSGMSYWQFLPLNAIFSDPSPYLSISSTGCNMYLISLEKLVDYGLLKNIPINPFKNSKISVDYDNLFLYKKKLLKDAYSNFLTCIDKPIYFEYLEFCEKNSSWLHDATLFTAIKEYFIYKRKRDAYENDFEEFEIFKRNYSQKISNENIYKYFYEGVLPSWPENLKRRDENTLIRFTLLLSDKISFYKFTQFIFHKQWQELHSYAKSQGIQLIGDIPIYMNYDSVDVWKHPNLFFLDKDLIPTKVAGVPPDYFSKDGQLWHNVLYDWKKHKKDNYKWWEERFENLQKLVDVIRIDHFRAFESYWAVPYLSESAKDGHWEVGPGEDFFNTLVKNKNLPIIAEDLGCITKEVRDLRRSFDLPGMFVAQFHLLNFKSRLTLEAKNKSNTVIYSATHDNQTTKSWIDSLNIEQKYHLSQMLECNINEICVSKILEFCSSLKFNTFIVPMQDLLNLDNSARMNTPGIPKGNWTWRIAPNVLTKKLEKEIFQILKTSNRL